MSDNIFGQRFLGYREPAWHGLGHVFEEPLKPSEALAVLPGGDVEVETIPVEVPIKIGKTTTKLATGQVAIIRRPTEDDPQPRFFGFAGTDYELMLNKDICAALDKLPYNTETLGLLEYGRRLFVTLKIGTTTVAGEDVDEYFVVTEGKDGGSAAKGAYTPVRVVCKNTLTLGLAQATFQFAVQHRAGGAGEFDFMVQVAEMAKVARAKSLEALALMGKTSLVESQIDEILLAAYPVPPEPKKVGLFKELTTLGTVPPNDAAMQKLARVQHTYEVFSKQVATHRDGARQLIQKINDEYPNVANTAWAAYNGVVECEDYRNGSENIGESALWGPRAQTKVRAFNAALQACA